MPRKKKEESQAVPVIVNSPFDDRTLHDERGCAYAFRNNDDINATGADFRMIVGERSNGKTYPTITFDGLMRFIDSGYTQAFAYIRRWDEDIKTNAPELFNGCTANGWLNWYTKGKYNNIQYYRGKWYLIRTDEHGDTVDKCKQPCAYAFSLSRSDHYKGADYPHIYTIIFDEFIADGAGYVVREWKKWQSVLSTIIRRRTDIVVYMIANSVSPNCEYFDRYGIHIDEIPQGTITEYKYKAGGTLALEYCDSTEGASNKAQPADKYFVIDTALTGSETGDMITRGKWEIEAAPHLPRRLSHKGRTVFRFWIVTGRNKIIQGNVIETGSAACVFFHNKTTPLKWLVDDYVYISSWDTDLIDKANIRVGFNSRYTLDNLIMKMIKGNRAYYDSDVTADKLNHFIEETHSF